MRFRNRFAAIVLTAVLAVWMSGFASGLSPDLKITERQQAEMKELAVYQELMSQGHSFQPWEKARIQELWDRYGDHELRPNSLDSQGGPDGFGYRYVDNQDGDSATFNWIELCGDNNASDGPVGDDIDMSIPLGMTFPFYGLNYTTAWISTNCAISFDHTFTDYNFSDYCINNAAIQAGKYLFPYWDDGYAIGAGGCNNNGTAPWIRYRNFGDHTVIEWDQLPHFSGTADRFTFEAILFTDGRIKYQYNTNWNDSVTPNSALIGIEDSPNANNGVQYRCLSTGATQITGGRAIWFYPSATGSVSGTVTAAGNPVPNARVRITESGAQAYTDAQGNYSFPLVAVGTYSMSASRHGYTSDSHNNIVVTENQNTTVNFQLTSLGYQIFTSGDVPQTIPTTISTVTSTLNITQPGSIQDLDVLVNITHSYDGDLRISLTSPDNITVILTNQHGLNGQNFNNTIFDDEADTTIALGHPPYDGDYIPDASLTGFDANNILGTWTLTIEDLSAGNGGSLNGWEIYAQLGPATGGSITGTVTSAVSGDPIAGAVVQIVETQVSRTTGANGQYTFNLVAAGTYSLHTTGGFYTAVTTPGVVVTEGQVTTQNIALPGSPSFSSDFEDDNGGWVATPATGAWEWGVPTKAGAPPAHSGTKVWATLLGTNYPSSVCWDLDLNPGQVIQAANAAVECWLWYQTEQSFDGCHFKVSTDNGATWNLITPVGGYPQPSVSSNTCIGASTPCWAGNSNTWIHVVLPLTNMVGQTPIFRFVFGSDASVTYQGVYIDDVAIWGLQPPFPVGTLTGTVRQFPNNTALPGAWVVAGTDSVQSDAQGQYSMTIQTGTYSVRFSHPTYCDSVRTNVVISENQTTTLNVSLKSPTADISVSSIQHEGVAGQISTETFDINNTGMCPLTFAITDNNSQWLSEAPTQGTVQAGGTQQITVTFDATNLGAGDFNAQITITHNATGSPANIPVDLHIPDVAGNHGDVPTEYALLGNYPNPFNAVTEIHYDVPQTSLVTITLYNVLGQDVRTLVNATIAAGHHVAVWDGRDDQGTTMTSGLYLLRMEAAGHVFTGKVMLLK